MKLGYIKTDNTYIIGRQFFQVFLCMGQKIQIRILPAITAIS